MDINVEKVKLGAIPRVSGKLLETEAHLRKGEEEFGDQVNSGEIPIGLRPPRLIPTGSVFIPKELVLPKQESPTEVDVVKPVVDLTLIPQNLENIRVKNETSVESSSFSQRYPQNSTNKPLVPHLDLLV